MQDKATQTPDSLTYANVVRLIDAGRLSEVEVCSMLADIHRAHVEAAEIAALNVALLSVRWRA